MLDPRTGEAQAADDYVVGLDRREVAMSVAPPSSQKAHARLSPKSHARLATPKPPPREGHGPEG
jgi:hypothetical protein